MSPQGRGSSHDEEILGKAYDARLMRRLWRYVRPHGRWVGLSVLVLLAESAAQLAQPYILKIAIDGYIAKRTLDGLGTLALLLSAAPAMPQTSDGEDAAAQLHPYVPPASASASTFHKSDAALESSW